MSLGKLVRFGPFEADLNARELRKGGLRLRVQEQPFEVLAALLERPGEIVSREELAARLWPKDTFVDFDQGLNAAVARLRQVLNDSAENPRYLETIARRGYRFLGTVVDVVPAGTQPAAEKRWWKRVVLPLGAALAATVGGLSLYQSQRGPPQPLQALPLTAELGTEACPSLSSDGNRVAFEWSQGTDEPAIFVKVVGRGNPVRLTAGSGGEYGPAWSRDGTQIAFIRKLNRGRIGVFVTPAFGGGERKLAEFAYLDFYSWRNTHRWLDWTPDGKYLVASGAEIGTTVEGLFLIPLQGGEKKRLTTPPTEINAGDRSPALSPDGRLLTFARASLHFAAEIYVLELSRDLSPVGEPRPLTNSGGNADGPVWMPEGREILYTMWGSGLWRLAVRGDHTPRRVEAADRGARFPTVARNGRVVFSEEVRDVNIWRQDLARTGTAFPPPERLIASSLGDSNAQYSPDGTQIAFESNRSGRDTIWICASDGARCHEMEAIGKIYAGTPRWSPDGRRIAFDARVDIGSPDIYVIDVEGGAPRKLTGQPTDNSIPSWSRDGRWIYFRSGRTGRNEVWKVPSSGGEAIQVTRSGGYVAFESFDGKDLLYTKSHRGSNLWRASSDGGDEQEVTDEVAWRAFAVASGRVYYMRASEGGLTSLVSRPLPAGTDSLIARIPRPLSEGLSLSPDGRYLIYSLVEQSGADLKMLDGLR